jgi:hypothetical protein
MTLAHLPSYGVPAALTMLAALALRLGFAGGAMIWRRWHAGR